MATSLSAQREENKKKNNELSDKRAAVVNANADASINELGTKYDEQQRLVAVQKLINERKVAESMANLGLTDSGLNRTQQTAVQLSAANAGYELNRQKQADISKINLQRDNSLSEIEQNRIATEMEINNTYDALEAQERAAKAAAFNVEPPTPSVSKIINKTAGVLNRDYSGTLAANGISVYYNFDKGTTTYKDNITGETLTFSYHTNPYTNSVNPDVQYGYYKSNGYQPNNINGETLVLEENGGWSAYGRKQNVFSIGSGNNKRYWVWYGAENRYIEVAKVNNKWVSMSSLFAGSILTGSELARRKNTATINGVKKTFSNYGQYIRAVLEHWYNQDKLTADEVAYLKGVYNLT